VDDLIGQSALLVSSIRWPLTAKLALAFLRHGCSVQVVCPPDPSLFLCEWNWQDLSLSGSGFSTLSV
jgi:hypothetical protein